MTATQEQMACLSHLQLFAIGAFIIIFVGIIIVFLLFYRETRKHNNELIRLTQYATNVQANIDSSIPDLLGKIIEDSFTDYQIMVLIPKNDQFIDSEQEKEIRDALTNKVADRISPNAIDKISLFYNPQQLGSIIADKIYITVMNYVVSHNALIMDQSESSSTTSQDVV